MGTKFELLLSYEARLHKQTSNVDLSSKTFGAPCGLHGCENMARSVSWPEVVKGVRNQGVDCLLVRAVFLSLFCVSGVCSVLFPYFWLSVPVQLIAWKYLSPK